MARRRSKTPLEDPAINLTPLIDVVFVILIMFIVVAPLLEIDRIELANGPSTPSENSHTVQEKSPVSIHVYANNTLSYNQQPVTLDQLKGHLAMAKKHTPTARPQLFHDRKACFGTYQLVKNAVEQAGFEQLDVILKPE